MKHSKKQRKNGTRKNSKKKGGGSKKNIKNIKCPPNLKLTKVKDQLLCVGKCPHSGGPIYYNPKLNKLVCRWHGSQFSLTGKVETPPARDKLQIKKIK